MRRSTHLFLVAVGLVTPLTASHHAIPVRDLGPVIARSTARVNLFDGLWGGLWAGVWEFANGRVLVNDGGNRRLLLFDSSLTTFTVLADTTGQSPIPYGTIVSPLIPFVGDSVLFLDFPSRSMLLIRSDGSVARAVAPVRPLDLARIRLDAPGVDPRGRLVYRGYRAPRAPATTAAPFVADSQPIVRTDFDARTVDTLAFIMRPSDAPPLVQARGADGRMSFEFMIRPVIWIDDWTLLPDGTIAIVRGHDYHIDWIAPDGRRTSTPKMPFDWRPITEAEKHRLIDSIRVFLDARDYGGRGGMSIAEAISRGLPEDNLRTATLSDGSKIVPLGVGFVPLGDIPDYVAPMRGGAVRSDLDGNLWILPNTSAQSRNGGLVYDIVNRRGEIFERVELPVGRLLAGFGRGGTAYLLAGNPANGFVIERARIY